MKNIDKSRKSNESYSSWVFHECYTTRQCAQLGVSDQRCLVVEMTAGQAGSHFFPIWTTCQQNKYCRMRNPPLIAQNLWCTIWRQTRHESQKTMVVSCPPTIRMQHFRTRNRKKFFFNNCAERARGNLNVSSESRHVQPLQISPTSYHYR